MDTYCNRATTVVYSFISMFGLCSLLCHWSTYLFNPQPTSSVVYKGCLDFTLNSFLNADQANIYFDLDLDLRPEFHWGQNYLFVYVIAKYESEQNIRNEVVVWDDVVGPGYGLSANAVEEASERSEDSLDDEDPDIDRRQIDANLLPDSHNKEVYAVIKKTNLKNKYPLTDQFARVLKGKKIQLVVRYQRFPIIGMLHTKEFAINEGSEFILPDKYFRSEHTIGGGNSG